jgi:hypothetical protein
MGLRIAIVGEPTKGKSTSIFPIPELGIKGLNPKETVILSFSGKMPPVRGANTMYSDKMKISEGGNFQHIYDVKIVPNIIKFISEKRPEIKNIVLEDGQFSMSSEFMARVKEKGYDKFTDIGVNFAAWMTEVQKSRSDLFCWIIWHPEKDRDGEYKMKTIGNMVDTYLTPEGLMDIILYADCEKNPQNKMDYFFVVNNNGVFPARSPHGMFDTEVIPNDMGFVNEKIREYYG